MDKELKKLEQRIATMESILTAYGLMKETQPIKIAAIALGQSESKLRKMIRESRLSSKSKIKAGIHYSFNGNRILINVNNWERDIKSIAPENR